MPQVPEATGVPRAMGSSLLRPNPGGLTKSATNGPTLYPPLLAPHRRDRGWDHGKRQTRMPVMQGRCIGHGRLGPLHARCVTPPHKATAPGPHMRTLRMRPLFGQGRREFNGGLEGGDKLAGFPKNHGAAMACENRAASRYWPHPEEPAAHPSRRALRALLRMRQREWRRRRVSKVEACVIAGLDPAIHEASRPGMWLCSPRHGLPGQARQ